MLLQLFCADKWMCFGKLEHRIYIKVITATMYIDVVHEYIEYIYIYNIHNPNYLSFLKHNTLYTIGWL